MEIHRHRPGTRYQNYSESKAQPYSQRRKLVLHNKVICRAAKQAKVLADEYIRRRKAVLDRLDGTDYIRWWKQAMAKQDKAYVRWWKEALRLRDKANMVFKPLVRRMSVSDKVVAGLGSLSREKSSRSTLVAQSVPRKVALQQLAARVEQVPSSTEYALPSKVVSFSAEAMKRKTYGIKAKGPALTVPKELSGSEVFAWLGSVGNRAALPRVEQAFQACSVVKVEEEPKRRHDKRWAA